MTRYDAFWLALTVGLGGLAVSAPAKAQAPLAPINHNPTSVTGQRVPTTTTSYTIFPQQGAVQGPYSPGPNNTVRLNAITGPTAGTPQGVTIEAIRKPHIPGTVPGDLHKGYTVRDKITVPKGTIATAGRILARAAPPLFIAATLYEALTNVDIFWDDDDQTFVKEKPPVSPNGNKVIYRRSGTGPQDAVFESEFTNGTVYETLDDVISRLDTVFPVGQPSGLVENGINCIWKNAEITTSTIITKPTRRAPDGGNCGLGSAHGLDVYTINQCPTGTTLTGGQCIGGIMPATDVDIETAILDASDLKFPNFLDTLLLPQVKTIAPVNIPADSPATLEIQDPITKAWLSDATVTMGSSAPQTSQSTTVNPDGSTRTETTQTVTELTTTVGGDTVTNNYIQNTTTNTTTTTVTITNTDNTTTTTTTTTVNNAPAPAPAPPTPDPDATPPPVTQDPPPDEPEEVPTFEDSDFPEVPELYVQKYPDGLMGVWAEKGPELMATDFMDAVASMIPDFDDNGQCPVWSMNFNWFSVAQWGTKPITAPCSLFELAGLIFIITSMFTSWRIIFGG